MSRFLLTSTFMLAVVGPAAGQPKKKDETVAKEWVVQTAALPAAQQIETVTAKFRELFGPHVGLGGAEYRDGAVVAIDILGMQYVEDVGPVAAFKKLESLKMAGGKVKDLAPLRGLPLKSLDCSANQIGGLDPLRGLPLEVLKCQAQTLRKTPDDWLAPVATLKGLKELACSGVRVNVLAGSGLKLEVLWTSECVWPKVGIGLLRGMPLRHLSVRSALSTDPTIQRGQPVAGGPGDVTALRTLTGLEQLDLEDNKAIATLDWVKPLAKLHNLSVAKTSVTSLDPLKGAKTLTKLTVNNTPVASLEPLRGLKLVHLDATSTNVVDLAPVEKVPLAYLAVQNTRVRDLKPLSGLPLTELMIPSTAVDDLSPLAGLKLVSLSLGVTKVKSLAALRGMPLTFLDIAQTAVTDLGPLRGMSIEYIILKGTAARDFEVLKSLEKLHRLDCDPKTPGLVPVLRQIKTLQTINDLPAAAVLK